MSKVDNTSQQPSAAAEEHTGAQAQEASATQAAAPQAANSSNWLKGLALVGILNGYIIGPMILFGLPGWWLARHFEAKWILVVALVIALIVSWVMILKNSEKQLKKLMLRK